jgi:hypothetical protein
VAELKEKLNNGEIKLNNTNGKAATGAQASSGGKKTNVRSADLDSLPKR